MCDRLRVLVAQGVQLGCWRNEECVDGFVVGIAHIGQVLGDSERGANNRRWADSSGVGVGRGWVVGAHIVRDGVQQDQSGSSGRQRVPKDLSRSIVVVADSTERK